MFFLLRMTTQYVCSSYYSRWTDLTNVKWLAPLSLYLSHYILLVFFQQCLLVCEISSWRYWNQFHYPPLLQTDWLISFTVTAKGSFNYLFILALWELQLQVELVIWGILQSVSLLCLIQEYEFKVNRDISQIPSCIQVIPSFNPV